MVREWMYEKNKHLYLYLWCVNFKKNQCLRYYKYTNVRTMYARCIYTFTNCCNSARMRRKKYWTRRKNRLTKNDSLKYIYLPPCALLCLEFYTFGAPFRALSIKSIWLRFLIWILHVRVTVSGIYYINLVSRKNYAINFFMLKIYSKTYDFR